MRGIVFSILEEMVENQFGIEIWNQTIDELTLKSDGIYAGTQIYDDEEVFLIVTKLSETLSIPVDDLVKAYGAFMFGGLATRYPIFLEGKSFFDFLESIGPVIHMEVEKLYPNSSLPEIQCKRESEHLLNMFYESPRCLGMLAIGLVEGAAKHFEVKMDINILYREINDIEKSCFEITLH